MPHRRSFYKPLFLSLLFLIWLAVPWIAYPRELAREQEFLLIHRTTILNQGGAATKIKARVPTVNWHVMPPYQAIKSIKCLPAVHWQKDGEFIEFSMERLDYGERKTYEVQSVIRHATIFDDPPNIKTYTEDLRPYSPFLVKEEGIPVGDPVLKAITASVVSSTDTPKEKARKLFAYVTRKLLYRIDMSRKADALQALHSGWGRCEDFAMLFVALCRTEGIPGRLVSGFRLGSDDLAPNGFIDVTEKLHMWAEVYLPKVGWVSVDPTYDSRINGERAIDYRFFAGFYPTDLHIFLWYGRKGSNIWYHYFENKPALQAEDVFLIKRLN